MKLRVPVSLAFVWVAACGNSNARPEPDAIFAGCFAACIAYDAGPIDAPPGSGSDCERCVTDYPGEVCPADCERVPILS